jgi:chemotaxis protein histidine kinase CheA
VIQPLGPCLQKVRLFSGTTILGDGRVALILDLSGALRHLEHGAELALSRAAE